MVRSLSQVRERAGVRVGFKLRIANVGPRVDMTS